jgi:hypothetical protein
LLLVLHNSPIAEELFFRGIVYLCFARSAGSFKTSIIDSSTFALIQFNAAVPKAGVLEQAHSFLIGRRGTYPGACSGKFTTHRKVVQQFLDRAM